MNCTPTVTKMPIAFTTNQEDITSDNCTPAGQFTAGNCTHSGQYSADEADDAIWILTSTFIIFTMQSGFGLLESGSVSAKNEVNIMVKNAADVIFGGLTYWLFGYAFSFGVEEPYTTWFNGWGNFLVITDDAHMGQIYSKFFFQASFATTATTIVSGAMAERTKLEAYILFSLLNTLVFCFPAHWEWAEKGWLKKLGVVDIAGAGSVHLVGGVTGLVATIMLKPRYGRYDSKLPPAMGSPTNAVLGTFMLWWGWLGFNCGSTFGISGPKWKLAARSAIATLSSSIAGGTVAFLYRSAMNTLVASLAGGMIGVFTSYVFKKKTFQVPFLINGLLGALVGITAFCALAEPWESFLIGVVGGTVALAGIEIIDKLKIDDPVGCVGVHAMGSIWSMLAVGLFAKKDPIASFIDINGERAGLFYGGGFYLLGVQLLAVVSIGVWTAVTSFILLKAIDLVIGLRVPLEEELLGADIVEHNVGDASYDKVTRTLTTPRGQAQLIVPPGVKFRQHLRRGRTHRGHDVDIGHMYRVHDGDLGHTFRGHDGDQDHHGITSMENGEVNEDPAPYSRQDSRRVSIYEESDTHAFGSKVSFRRSRGSLPDVSAINRVLSSPSCQRSKSTRIKRWPTTTKVISAGRAFNDLFKHRRTKTDHADETVSVDGVPTISGDVIVNDHAVASDLELSTDSQGVVANSVPCRMRVDSFGSSQNLSPETVHMSTIEETSNASDDQRPARTNTELLSNPELLSVRL